MSDILLKSGTFQKKTKSEKDRNGGVSLYNKIREFLGSSESCCTKTIVADSYELTTANHNVAIIPTGTQDNIAAGTGGAISINRYLTTINTDAGGDAFTLANATITGLMKKILLVVDGGGNAVITPTSLSGGTTITMNDVNDYVILQWNGTAWVVIENSGCTVA